MTTFSEVIQQMDAYYLNPERWERKGVWMSFEREVDKSAAPVYAFSSVTRWAFAWAGSGPPVDAVETGLASWLQEAVPGIATDPEYGTLIEIGKHPTEDGTKWSLVFDERFPRYVRDDLGASA